MKGIFDELAEHKRWVPYTLKYDPNKEKFDKIPHNGSRGLSTQKIDDWLSINDAAECAEKHGLTGLGFVMTGGIEHAGWRLAGLDFDDVDFDNFTLPFATYMERSPSKKGIRAFAWVPIPWVIKYKDTTFKCSHCHHGEIYFGSSARFLTITFDNINEEPIAELNEKALHALEKWGLTPAEVKRPVVPAARDKGKSFDIKTVQLTPDQIHLVEGSGDIDRSAVMHGLLIKLIDTNHSFDDIVVTLIKNPALWLYFLDHRNHDQKKALRFIHEEYKRAYEKSLIGMRQALVSINADWMAVADKESAMEELSFPVTLFDDSYGLVREVAHWIHAASYVPRKEFSLACALSLVACLIGPYCTHGSRSSKSNLYMTLVGETGSGKTEAIDSMGMLMAATEAKDCITDFPASEAAIRRQLNVTPNVLMKIDELAHKLDSMKNNSNGSALGRAILDMYNGGRLPPKAYADERKCLEAVENPFVQILGGTTDKVWDVVKSSHMDDGTLNRFIFVCLPEKPKYSRNFHPNGDIPKALKDKLNAFFRNGRMCDLIGYVPPGFGRKITFDKEVEKAIIEYDLVIYELQQKEYGSLYVRFIQNTMKIAAIMAIGDGRNEVTMKDFETARLFMKWSIGTTYYKVNKHMFENHYDKQQKKLMAKLNEVGKIRMRDAYKFMHVMKREMEEIVATLIAAGEIVVAMQERGGKTAIEWIVKAEKEGDE